MSIKLKPIDQQVIFITGATSEIGLATVRMAIFQGAKVFMVGQNEEELQNIQDDMRLKNLPTAYAIADVADIDQLQIAADHCLETFGTIDSWINNAEVSTYARLLETNEAEAKRLFDTNFWGVVNGCKVAASILSKSGGSILNLGNVLSPVSLPILGIYEATKEAVKGYTNALKRELVAVKAPIAVSFLAPKETTPEAIATLILKGLVKPVRENMMSLSRFPRLRARLMPHVH